MCYYLELWQCGVPLSFSLSIFSFTLEVLYGLLISALTIAQEMVQRETEGLVVVSRALQPRYNRKQHQLGKYREKNAMVNTEQGRSRSLLLPATLSVVWCFGDIVVKERFKRLMKV